MVEPVIFGIDGEPAMDGSRLALSDVAMEYSRANGPPLRILSDLELTVSAGQLVCLAGRSGSGKTTAVMIAAGLLHPTSGAVSWGSIELSKLEPDQITRERGRRVGIVFQNAALIATLRAGENVALAGMAENGRRPDPTRVEQLLSLVGLAERGDHFPAQLSGGEQQRLALARALYRDPPLLLIDEPTANLDRTTADGIIATLDRLRQHGRALLIASHDQALIAVADRVVEME